MKTTVHGERKQTGAKISTVLYLQLRALALLQGRQVGELIDDAIVDYLAKEAEAAAVTKRTKAPRHKRG